MTDREGQQRALLDRVEDERDRIRAAGFRRSIGLVAWALVAAAALAVVAWFLDAAMMAAHPVWSGLALGVVVVAADGLAVGALRWLRLHQADVRRLRAVGRECRDHELDGWQETSGEDLRDRQRLLDDLDDARDDLRRTVRRLIGWAVAVAVFAGAVAAETWWTGAQWQAVWEFRLLFVVTATFGVSALEVLVSLMLGKRLASAKANLRAAQRRHRDSALYDAEPPGDRPDVAESPPTRRGVALAVPIVGAALCVTLLNYSGVNSLAVPVATAPTAPSVPTKLAARESSVPVDAPSGVAVSPDGRRAYVANAGSPDHPSATVVMVDLGTQTVTATVRVPPRPMALALTPDGRRLLVASIGSTAAPAGALTVIDTAARHVVSTIPLASTPGDVTVSPDGRIAWCVITGASTYSPGAAVTVDLAKAIVVGSVPVGVDPDGVVVAPDGRRTYVANYFDDTVSVIDTTTRTVVATVPTGSGPSGLAVDQRRHTVWVANQDESDAHQAMTAIDTNTLATTPVDLGPAAPGTGGAGPVALTPDGRHLLVGRYSADTDQHPLLDVVDPVTRRVTTVITMPWPYHIATTLDSHHALLSSGNLWELDIP